MVTLASNPEPAAGRPVAAKPSSSSAGPDISSPARAAAAPARYRRSPRARRVTGFHKNTLHCRPWSARGRCSAAACTTPRSAPRTSSPSCCPGRATGTSRRQADPRPRTSGRADRGAAGVRRARAHRDLRGRPDRTAPGRRSNCARCSRPGTSAAAAERINGLLAGRAHPPRLTTHGGGSGWHLHVDSSDDAPWAEWFLTSSCLALAVLLAERQAPPGRDLRVAFLRQAVRERGPGSRAPLLLGRLRQPRAGGRAP